MHQNRASWPWYIRGISSRNGAVPAWGGNQLIARWYTTHGRRIRLVFLLVPAILLYTHKTKIAFSGTLLQRDKI